MKNKITKLFLVLMISNYAANAQTDEERKEITKGYNQEWFKNAVREGQVKYEREYAQAVSIANEKGLPLAGVDSEGNYFQLVGLIEETGELKYYQTNRIAKNDNVLFNNSATQSSIQTARVQFLHDMDIQGQGMIVG